MGVQTLTTSNMAQCRLVGQNNFNNRKVAVASPPQKSPGLLLFQSTTRHHKHNLLIAHSSKADELAAMQNFKFGLDQALKAAAATAGAEAAAAEAASGEPDLPSIEGPSFWSTIRSLPPTQLAIVLCYTNKCIPCKAAKPQIIEWVKEKGDQVTGFKFALTLPNKDVAIAMGVKTSPVFLFFKNGKLIETIRGGKELHLVKEFMDRNS